MAEWVRSRSNRVDGIKGVGRETRWVLSGLDEGEEVLERLSPLFDVKCRSDADKSAISADGPVLQMIAHS